MFCKPVLLLLFVALCYTYAQEESPECPVNEIYKACGLKSCEPKCGDTGVKLCATVCQAGCYCMDSYLRNSNGDCVLPEDC